MSDNDSEQFERCEYCGGLVYVNEIRICANPQHDDEGNEYTAYKRACIKCRDKYGDLK